MKHWEEMTPWEQEQDRKRRQRARKIAAYRIPVESELADQACFKTGSVLSPTDNQLEFYLDRRILPRDAAKRFRCRIDTFLWKDNGYQLVPI